MDSTSNHTSGTTGTSEMNIQVQSISISHLPSFISGYTIFRNHNIKKYDVDRIGNWLDLPIKLKRKFSGKASLMNKKKYVEQIHKLIRTEGVSQENAEILVDTSVVNVINVILSKEKETGLYKFFQLHNPGLSADKDLPLAWYALDATEKKLWQSAYENPTESTTNESDNEVKRLKNYKVVAKPPKPDIKPNTSPESTQECTTQLSLPDAIHESRALLQQLVNEFVAIEVLEGITLVKYLVGNCDNWTKWLDWYTELCSKTFTSLAELQTEIFDHLKELRANLTELNFTKSQWFSIVQKFMVKRHEICGKRLRTSHCTLELNELNQKVIYKKFQRDTSFVINFKTYGLTDFVYVKNREGALNIVKISKIDAQAKTFSGYLFKIEKPSDFVQLSMPRHVKFATYVNARYLFVFKMRDVVGRCLVLDYKEYFEGRPIDLNENDIFYCPIGVNLKCGTQICSSPILKGGLDRYWGEVYYFKNDGKEKQLKVDDETTKVTSDEDDSDEDSLQIEENVESAGDDECNPLKLYHSSNGSNNKSENEDDDEVIVID